MCKMCHGGLIVLWNNFFPLGLYAGDVVVVYEGDGLGGGEKE